VAARRAATSSCNKYIAPATSVARGGLLTRPQKGRDDHTASLRSGAGVRLRDRLRARIWTRPALCFLLLRMNAGGAGKAAGLTDCDLMRAPPAAPAQKPTTEAADKAESSRPGGEGRRRPQQIMIMPGGRVFEGTRQPMVCFCIGFGRVIARQPVFADDRYGRPSVLTGRASRGRISYRSRVD